MHYTIIDRITGEASPVLLDGAEVTEWLTTHYEDAPDEVYEAAERFGELLQAGELHVVTEYASFFNVGFTVHG